MTNANQLLKLSSKVTAKSNDRVINLIKVDNFSYSAVMRELVRNCDDEQVEQFLSLYKKFFDESDRKGLQKPEHVALQNAIIELSKSYKVQVPKELVKSAAISELGSAEDIGHYLANVIKFIMSKISDESRPKSMSNLKNKLLNMSPSEISNKEIPSSASIGQSITFVKNVLFNHETSFITEVIRYMVNKL